MEKTYSNIVKEIEEELLRTSRNVQLYGKLIRNQLDYVDRMIEEGRMINKLGELQSLSSQYEAAIGAVAQLQKIMSKLEE